MKRSRLLFSIFTFISFVLSTTLTLADKKDEAPKPGEDKPFADVIKDFKEIPGLFTLYWKQDENKVLLEIKPEQLDKIYVCAVTREAGDGRYFDSGSMLDDFPFIFHKVGKKIQFLHKNVYFRADSGSPISRAIESGVTSSLIGSAKIESAPHPDRKSLLIDPTTLFIQDYALVTYSLQEAMKINFTLDKENSYFNELKSFPKNTEVEVLLTYTTGQPKSGFGPIADTRSIQHRYHYSLAQLPDSGYRPRLADDRVGHFLTMYQDYSNQETETAYRRYVNRWRLEKSNPNEAISPPKQQIVYWLENTIPVEYRDAVREGVLVWNKAFEKAGFKDAIVVQQQPDTADWDGGDIRYSTIRWIVMPGGGYAVGPSRTDPFTGEIYDADIRISSDFVRYVNAEYEEFINPILNGESNFPIRTGKEKFTCNYASGMMRQAAFGWSMLEARSAFMVSDEEKKKYIYDMIVSLVAHEVGHTLGLRHNFRSSTIHKFDEMQNKELTLAEGVAGSMMEYTPVNIAPDGQPQGQYWQTTLGTYDYWAIEYAYKPIDATSPDDELPHLNAIASRVADPKLAYGTDEDAFGFSPVGIDPVTNVWDLSDDPLAFYKNRAALSNELWSKMEEKFSKPGTRYQKFLRVFSQGFGDYFLGGLTASKYIGGMYFHRDHVGDPGNRLPYEPVSPKKQREALDFIKTHILGPNAFNFKPSLLNKLMIERFYDFEFSVFQIPRLDFPLHEVILNIQQAPLNRLYHPINLDRLVDMEMRYDNPKDKFTMAEMFKGIREAVWSELSGGKNVKSFRRELQRAHLTKLIDLIVKPAPGTPADATTLARADLQSIQRAIDATPKAKLDDMTTAHLDETKARIDAALKAAVQRQITTPGMQ
jgi:hypothetical protein